MHTVRQMMALNHMALGRVARKAFGHQQGSRCHRDSDAAAMKQKVLKMSKTSQRRTVGKDEQGDAVAHVAGVTGGFNSPLVI